MSTSFQNTPAPVVQPQQDTFREERDALLPRNGYVVIPTEDGEGEEYLKIPRLNMRRTLRLSQWLDAVGSREEVVKTLDDLMRVMDANGETEGPGFATILSINKFISSLELQEALELFSIITNMSHEWLDERWEIGWGIQAIRVAFQQQGFANLFANTANQDSDTAGETASGKTIEEVSVPQSISSSPHMGGQTMTSLNSHQND